MLTEKTANKPRSLHFGMLHLGEGKSLINKVRDDLTANNNGDKCNHIDTSEGSMQELNDFKFSRSRFEPENIQKDAIRAQIKTDLQSHLLNLQRYADQKLDTDETPYSILRQTFDKVASADQIKIFKQTLVAMNENDRQLFPSIMEKAKSEGRLTPFEVFQEIRKKPDERSPVLNTISTVKNLSPLAGINYQIGSVMSGPFRRTSIIYLVSKPKSEDLPIINL